MSHTARQALTIFQHWLIAEYKEKIIYLDLLYKVQLLKYARLA